VSGDIVLSGADAFLPGTVWFDSVGLGLTGFEWVRSGHFGAWFDRQKNSPLTPPLFTFLRFSGWVRLVKNAVFIRALS
jgi:hypothetical protein